MNKISLFLMLTLIATTVFAQKIETVKTTTPMNSGGKLELSYSFYQGSDGQKILHGAFRAKSTQVEQKQGTTGTKLIECTFRDGLVDGKFHYEVHTQEYVGERVMTPYGVALKVVRKPGLDVNENITFNTSKGYMTGDINFTAKIFGLPRTFRGKVQDSLIVDGTDFMSKVGGYEEEIYRNYKPLPSEHANLKPVSSADIKLYFDVAYLDEDLEPCVKLPLYVGKNLSDYPSYVEALQYRDSDPEKFITALQNLPQKELSKEEADSVSTMIKAYYAEQRKKEEMARRMAEEEKANYEQACKEYDALCKKCSVVGAAVSLGNQYVIDRSVERGWIPIIIDEHIENILIQKYSIVLKDAIDFFAKPETSAFTSRPWVYKPQGKTSAEVRFEIMSFPWEFYLPMREQCATIMWQQKKIELFYTNTTTRRSLPEGVSRNNCEKKIVKKKDLYIAYCAIAEYLDNQIPDQTDFRTIEKYFEIIDKLSKVSQKLFDYANIESDTKELEKALKKAKTVEDKLEIILR